jgi:hypothetical protein
MPKMIAFTPKTRSATIKTPSPAIGGPFRSVHSPTYSSLYRLNRKPSLPISPALRAHGLLNWGTQFAERFAVNALLVEEEPVGYRRDYRRGARLHSPALWSPMLLVDASVTASLATFAVTHEQHERPPNARRLGTINVLERGPGFEVHLAHTARMQERGQ